ncbi:hypothetical protein P3H15_37450 [Rhodococcus sp. T2V]|uniref:hypothetical protein n=1 Tax=Rhodococcus sp. T2V TaxID=3034164 RepID=UPI0023E0F1EB|nr:hypothetical protein [Rhodococcus sp. T2V]MDF3310700.1 hypothetical protein [Rhodococcus sp. T2V]
MSTSGLHTITVEVDEVGALHAAHRAAELEAWDDVRAAGGNDGTYLRLVSIDRSPEEPGKILVTAPYSSVHGGLRAS